MINANETREVKTTVTSLEGQLNGLGETALVTQEGDTLTATLRAGLKKIEVKFDVFEAYCLDHIRTKLGLERHKVDPVIELTGALAGSTDDEKRSKGVAQKSEIVADDNASKPVGEGVSEIQKPPTNQDGQKPADNEDGKQPLEDHNGQQ